MIYTFSLIGLKRKNKLCISIIFTYFMIGYEYYRNFSYFTNDKNNYFN